MSWSGNRPSRGRYTNAPDPPWLRPAGMTNSAPMALGILALGTSLLPEGSDFGGVLHVHHALSSDLDVDPEAKRVLGVALEKTRVSLGLADDFANGIIARRIVELAKAGKRNPDLLCEGAIEQLRGHLYGD